jgi:DNA segregation ATPase FtsK/SpoIIIE, S-DNA-T family
MLEWLIFPIAIGVSGFIKTEKNEKQKIETIFKNIGFGISQEGKLKIPDYKKTYPIKNGEKKIGTTYLFGIPLGLPATHYTKAIKNMEVFEASLRKPCDIEIKNGYLQLHVYNNDIPERFEYSQIDEEPKSKWEVPLGVTPKGFLWHDFDLTPHMTISGTARFGKTVLLKHITTWLIENNPDDIELFIIDLKGGIEFNRFKDLKQVRGVAKNPFEAAKLLSQVLKNIKRDEEDFLKHYYTNIVETDRKKRTFIITDEGAELTPQKHHSKDEKHLLNFCQSALSEICRVAGALGYRNIFCTQYPTADCLPRQIKINSDIKISFRLGTGYASEVAIDERGAEDLPSDIKGRALVKTHEIKEIQVPYISNNEMWNRLKQYEVVKSCDSYIQQGEEKNKTREDFVQFG